MSQCTGKTIYGHPCTRDGNPRCWQHDGKYHEDYDPKQDPGAIVVLGGCVYQVEVAR